MTTSACPDPMPSLNDAVTRLPGARRESMEVYAWYSPDHEMGVESWKLSVLDHTSGQPLAGLRTALNAYRTKPAR